MRDAPNRPNKVIVRPYDNGYWMIVGVNNFTEREEIYLTGMNLEDAEHAAQVLADRYGVPVIKEEK